MAIALVNLLNSVLSVGDTVSLDLFATRCHSVPRPLSPGYWHIINSNMYAFLFSPMPLLPWILSKIKEKWAKIFLIALNWPYQLWFPEVLSLLIDVTRKLPEWDDLLTQNQGRVLYLCLRLFLLTRSRLLSRSLSEKMVFLTRLRYELFKAMHCKHEMSTSYTGLVQRETYWSRPSLSSSTSWFFKRQIWRRSRCLFYSLSQIIYRCYNTDSCHRVTDPSSHLHMTPCYTHMQENAPVGLNICSRLFTLSTVRAYGPSFHSVYFLENLFSYCFCFRKTTERNSRSLCCFSFAQIRLRLFRCYFSTRSHLHVKEWRFRLVWSLSLRFLKKESGGFTPQG